MPSESAVGQSNRESVGRGIPIRSKSSVRVIDMIPGYAAVNREIIIEQPLQADTEPVGSDLIRTVDGDRITLVGTWVIGVDGGRIAALRLNHFDPAEKIMIL